MFFLRPKMTWSIDLIPKYCELETVIFIFYFLLCSYALVIIPFFKKAPLSSWLLIALFALKIFAGFAFAWFYKLPQYYPTADTWRFYHLSLTETKWLLSDPAAFVKDLFTYGYKNPGNVFSGSNSYWNDLKSNGIIKLMAAMNVVTNSSYYTNIILFNFLFLFGLIGIFRVFSHLFTPQKWLLVLSIFLLPSTLFWCSGIHKDGLILSATGLILYCQYRWLHTNGSAAKYLSAILLLLLLIFSLRNYVALALVPALTCWAISNKTGWSPTLLFLTVYITGIVLFFSLPIAFSGLNFPAFLASKQHEFMALQGGSAIEVMALQPTFKNFAAYFPTAFDMAFLRPHLGEAKNFSYLPAAVEVIALWLIALTALLFPRKKIPAGPFILCCFFFSISILLVTGYTITFSGAVVRYRSFLLPLLFTPLLCMININLLKTKAKQLLAKK